MQDSKYIYGIDEDQIKRMKTLSYPDALMFQKKSAKILLEKLIKNPKNFRRRDDFRINKVEKAIQHNTEKLKEIGIEKDYKVSLPRKQKPLKRRPKKKNKNDIIIHPNQSTLDDF